MLTNHFNRNFDLEEHFPWDKVYTLPYNTTIESTTRVIQYKILNNILYLNKRLHRKKLAESPLCCLCKLYPETISHLFFECKVSSQLWKEIQGEFYPYLVLPNLDIELILFGILYDQDQQKVKNHIILIFKKFLYEKRDCPNKKMGTIKSLTFFVVVQAVAFYTEAILSTVSFSIVALLPLGVAELAMRPHCGEEETGN